MPLSNGSSVRAKFIGDGFTAMIQRAGQHLQFFELSQRKGEPRLDLGIE